MQGARSRSATWSGAAVLPTTDAQANRSAFGMLGRQSELRKTKRKLITDNSADVTQTEIPTVRAQPAKGAKPTRVPKPKMATTAAVLPKVASAVEEEEVNPFPTHNYYQYDL